MTAQDVIYAIDAIIYLVLFVMLVVAARGIRRELARIADRLNDRVD